FAASTHASSSYGSGGRVTSLSSVSIRYARTWIPFTHQRRTPRLSIAFMWDNGIVREGVSREGTKNGRPLWPPVHHVCLVVPPHLVWGVCSIPGAAHKVRRYGHRTRPLVAQLAEVDKVRPARLLEHRDRANDQRELAALAEARLDDRLARAPERLVRIVRIIEDDRLDTPTEADHPGNAPSLADRDDRRLWPVLRDPAGAATRLRQHHEMLDRRLVGHRERRAGDRVGEDGILASRVVVRLLRRARSHRALHLDLPDDAIHRPDRLDRILADGRLGGQHHGVRAVPDGIRDVAGLGPGRDGLRDHRLEHLRRRDHRRAEPVAHRDDALLGLWHLLRRQLDAQVAASDHHAVRLLGDLLDVLQRLRSLDFRDQAGHMLAMLAGDVPRHAQVFGVIQEAEAEEVDTVLHRERDVLAVDVRQGPA